MDKKQKIQEPLVHNINTMNNTFFSQKLFVFLVIAIVLGGISGYLLVNKGGTATNVATTENGSIDASSITKGTVVGSDAKTFKDTAEGVLKGGGIEGEGQFHLERPGGKSQNVYMTSSIVDLSLFVGKKVKVWGETQAAQYAGWLMDVGRVEVLE